MNGFRSRTIGIAGLSLLLAAGLAAQGCVSYTSNYKVDPRTRQTAVGLDRAAATAGPVRLAVEGAPTAASPFTPLSVRLSRTLTGPEATITTVREQSYRHQWTPFLIPLGALIVPTAPMAFLGGILSGEPDKAFTMIFGGDPSPCKYGMFMNGLHWIVGIDPSCTVVDSRTAEEKVPTGRTTSVDAPVAGAPVEFRLSARGEEPAVRTYDTDSSGRVALPLQPLVEAYRDTPSDLAVAIRAASGEGAETLRLDAETARLLYAPVGEERAGDRAAAEGKGLVALEHYSRAHEALSAAPDTGDRRSQLWQKIAVTYRSLSVKPPVPEETRRLLVQAQTLSKNDDVAGGIAKLNEILRKAPWLPTAWYNLAMAESAVRNYPAAINAMNGYLQLAPDSTDARAAKDKIYEWETLAPAAARKDEPFSGIGLEIRKTAGRIEAVRAIPGGAAEKAGIRPGDVLEQIAGRPTEGLDVEGFVQLARGPAGSTVTLRVLRPATGARFTHELRREIVRPEPGGTR